MTAANVLAGRYALGAVLGRGGMGTVWSATDQVLHREVAIKTLQLVDAPTDAVERFRREARILAGLTHPNVVTVFDFGIDEERAWLVMELLPGPTLAQLLASDGALPIDQVVTVGREVAGALAAAHQAGIIHRDIKPANLMLDGAGRCKLLDLGIARLAGTTADTAIGLTQTGMILGTALYVAPELVHGAAAAPSADMYAFGATLFALLTGGPPFQGETTMGTLVQHVSAPVPRASASRSDIPAELDALITALLAKEPAARPTATEVVQRLSSPDPAPTLLLATPTLPTQLLPTQLPPTQTSRPRSRRLVTIAVAAVAVALAALLVIALRDDGTGHPQPAGTTSPSPSLTPTPTPTTRPSSPSPSPQVPLSVAGALSALRNAIDRAAETGGLAQPDAQDFSHRVDDLAKSVGNGNVKDVLHKLDDFEHRLADDSSKGHVTRSSYNHILHAAEELRRALPAG